MTRHSALLTDLYQLRMLDAYLKNDMCAPAVFEFFVRRLPTSRAFLVAAGLEQLLDYLADLSFSSPEIDWLRSTELFSARLLDYLADFRFSGDVCAMPEGTVFFGNEPIVQVVAPLPEAQLVETRLINLVHLQSLIASKAARCVLAAPRKTLVDFGMRRAHGAESALLGARASYIAGFAGTSNVAARAHFDIPIFGTMAHSFVQAHSSETEAFEDFARAFPEGSVLLIDTYDTLEGARRAATVIRLLRKDGIVVSGVRLDSGDLAALATEVRAILDEGGCTDVSIFCSGNIDEYMLARDFGVDIPADGFGVGTQLDVCADAPYLDCVYKIQEYAGVLRRKLSTGKATVPGRKQVFRVHDEDGRLQRDVIAGFDERLAGRGLLDCVMRGGQRVAASPALEAVRDHAASELAALRESMRDPFSQSQYDVRFSSALQAVQRSPQTS